MCGAHRRFQIVTHENPTFSLTTKVQSSVEEEGDFLSGTSSTHSRNGTSYLKGADAKIQKSLVLKLV